MTLVRTGVGVTLAACGVMALAVAGPTAQQQRPMPKNNSACLVCHANFAREEVTAKHLARGITCARCHGLSYDHMNDEEAAAKPDILFGRAEVERFCKTCHKAHRNPSATAQFLAEWKGKRRPHGRLILPNAACTDCHGLHRLPRGGATRP